MDDKIQQEALRLKKLSEELQEVKKDEENLQEDASFQKRQVAREIQDMFSDAKLEEIKLKHKTRPRFFKTLLKKLFNL